LFHSILYLPNCPQGIYSANKFLRLKPHLRKMAQIFVLVVVVVVVVDKILF
jgi:hypothetical protein